MAAANVLSVEHLSKEYRLNFRRAKVRAVTDATFSVQPGEIFGFVGPNGAGKTTTIRALMGLIRPTSGSCSIFGKPAGTPSARARLGFFPEAPYFYDYLTPRELLDLTGRLFGVDAATRRTRAKELIERVGLSAAADRPLRKFSKGMLQRAGLAQALMNAPELVVLDEPMSGLDPLGRKEVRDLIVELRDAGTTVFFSTHILPDVEAVCDRVAIIAEGKIQEVGTVARLLETSLRGTEVVAHASAALALDALLPADSKVRRREGDDELSISLPPTADVTQFLRDLAALGGVRIISVTPRRESLEDLFMRKTVRS